MEFLNNYIIPSVIGICLISGYLIKNYIDDVDNKHIPAIVTVLGAFLAIWFNYWHITPEIILSGMISGLSSTGMHQLLKQYINKDSTQ